MPVYNRESLVSRVIESIQAQTFTNWELILVDDASTDKTRMVIDQYIQSDSRIFCIENINKKGPSGARNTGLDYADGKYIAYQDSDDEWVPYHLERMVYFLEKYYEKIDLMTADPLRKYENTGEIFNYDKMDMSSIKFCRVEDGYLIDKSELFDKQLRGRVITTQCLVGKAEVMKSVRWNESLNAAVDIMHNLELCTKDINVCHLSDYQAIYWAHDDNLTNVTGTHKPERMERVHGAFALYWETVLSEMELTNEQRIFVKKNLAACYAWHLAYNTFEKQHKYLMAAKLYAKAIKIQPLHMRYLFSFFKVLVKLSLGYKC